SILLILIPHPLTSTLFPYTTLFRSSTCRRWKRTSPESELHGYKFCKYRRRLRCCCRWNDGRFLGRSTWSDVTRNGGLRPVFRVRSEEHTSELQSRENLVCRLLLEKK